jgi:hypothetical protein
MQEYVPAPISIGTPIAFRTFRDQVTEDFLVKSTKSRIATFAVAAALAFSGVSPAWSGFREDTGIEWDEACGWTNTHIDGIQLWDYLQWAAGIYA